MLALASRNDHNESAKEKARKHVHPFCQIFYRHSGVLLDCGAGADASKPARRYEITEIVAPLNPKCEPGFAHSTFTRRMNESGQIVGYHEWRQSRHFDETGQCIVRQDAVLWETDGTQRLLAMLPGHTQGTALGINEQSLVAGRSELVPLQPMCNAFSVERQRAVIWHKNRVTDLNALLKRRDAQKIQLTSASAITECGQVAAYGFYRDEPLQKCWTSGSTKRRVRSSTTLR